ncbi:MAG: T9SS type A sorting domain-containing protein [Bacteroidota bacterium]
MKTKYYVLSFILFLLLGKTTQASYIVGADLSYQCTPTPGIYKVTLKVYRDCQGLNICAGCATGNTSGCTTASTGFSTPILGADSPCLSTNYGNYTLSIKPGNNNYDIIQTCNSVKTICTNCNTRTAGTFSTGIEVYIFEGNVNLNTIPSSCCKVALGLSFCCRNTAITNFTPGSFYTECIINRCIAPCNNAPTFTNEAVPLVCAGVDFVYNLGAIDPDGDSLSYAFGSSLSNQGIPVSYSPPYSAGYPFAYLGAPNPNAPYPAGLRIDPITGDILFRPSGAWVSNLVIEVTQWKKIGNTYVNVGVTRRDIQFQTQLCSANLVPRIKIFRNGVLQTGQSFSVCAGQQICLDIVAEDQQNLAASPAPILADTTDLTWNNPGQFSPVMANATWVRNYVLAQRGIQGPKADSFKFCWTPTVAAARTLPHSFTVKGSDRFCPLPTSAIRGINITVVAIPIPIITVVDKKCGFRDFSFVLANPTQTTLNTSQTQWQIEATPGGGFFTNINSQSLANYRFNQGGTYKYRLRLNSVLPSPSGCPSKDSGYIVNQELLDVSVPDTYNCIGSPVKITALASGGNRISNTAFYEFFQGGISSQASLKGSATGVNRTPDSTLTISPTNTTTPTQYKVKIGDWDGCIDSATFYVNTKVLPLKTFASKIRLCANEDTTLYTGNDTVALQKKYWYKLPGTIPVDSQTSLHIPSLQQGDSATYVLNKTNIYGCSTSDTVRFYVNPPVIYPVIADTICIKGNYGLYIRKRDSSLADSIVQITSTGIILPKADSLWVSLNDVSYKSPIRIYKTFDGRACYKSDTAMVKVNASPVVNSPTPVSLCSSQKLFTINNVNVNNHNPSQTSQVWTYPLNPNTFALPNDKNTISIDSLKYIPPSTGWNGKAYGNYIYVDIKSNINGCSSKDSLLLALFPAPTQPNINLANNKLCDFDRMLNLYDITKNFNPSASGEIWNGNGVSYNASINRWFFNPNDTPNIVGGNNIGGKVNTGLSLANDSNILTYKYTRQFASNVQVAFNPINTNSINVAPPTKECVTSDTVLFRVTKSPKLKAGTLTTLCARNDSILINNLAIPNTNSTSAINAATSYWYFSAPNNNLKAILKGQVLVPSHPSLIIPKGSTNYYKIVYADTATGCRVTDTTTLTIKGLPIVRITNSNLLDSAVCLTKNTVPLLLTPNPLLLVPGANKDSFALTGAPGLESDYGKANGTFNINNPDVQEQAYKLRYYYKMPEGCSATDSITVRVQYPSKVKLQTNLNVCELNREFTVKINPASKLSKYPYGLIWEIVNSKGIVKRQTPDSLVYMASVAEISSGFVKIKVTTDNLGICPIPDSDSATFIIHQRPKAGTITGTTNTNNANIPFDYSITQQNNITYNWMVNNGNIQSGQGTNAIKLLFTNKGPAQLKAAIVDSNSCVDTSYLNINVYNIGINNIDMNTSIKVYPNPSKSSITISNKNLDLLGKQYTISSVTGIVLLGGKLNTEETLVNIESLSSGIYFLSIEGISNQSIKIIKE